MVTSSSIQSTSVDAIFERAERVFERRVDQLLLAKRAKATAAGTPFNARKAKRDARTVAGREKLDALVRRLADLAIAQEAVLNCQDRQNVATSLQGAAAVVLAVSASISDTQVEQPITNVSTLSLPEENIEDSTKSIPNDRVNDSGKDLFDTSSCSDDCYDAMPMMPLMKDIRDVSDNDDKDIITTTTSSRHIIRSGNNNVDYIPNFHSSSSINNSNDASQSHHLTNAQSIMPLSHRVSSTVPHAPLFEATESVVNFVLECDDEEHDRTNLVKMPSPVITHDITSAREYINAMESARAVAQSQWHSTGEEYASSY